MTEQILNLSLEISAYVSELHELTKTLKDVDEACIKEASKENQLFMQETIERYKNVVNKLRIILECYFAEESKEGLPTEFSYRKLYKKLKQAY